MHSVEKVRFDGYQLRLLLAIRRRAFRGRLGGGLGTKNDTRHRYNAKPHPFFLLVGSKVLKCVVPSVRDAFELF